MTTKDEVREEIKTRLLYALGTEHNVDIAVNSMEDLFNTLLAKKREAVESLNWHEDFENGLRKEWIKRSEVLSILS